MAGTMDPAMDTSTNSKRKKTNNRWRVEKNHGVLAYHRAYIPSGQDPKTWRKEKQEKGQCKTQKTTFHRAPPSVGTRPIKTLSMRWFWLFNTATYSWLCTCNTVLCTSLWRITGRAGSCLLSEAIAQRKQGTYHWANSEPEFHKPRLWHYNTTPNQPFSSASIRQRPVLGCFPSWGRCDVTVGAKLHCSTPWADQKKASNE